MAHPPPSSLHSPQNRRTGRARFGRGDPSFRFSPWSLSRTTTLRPLAAFRHTRADKRKPKLTEAATNVRPRNGKSGARRLNISRLSDRSLKHTIHVFYKPCGHRKQYFRFFASFLLGAGSGFRLCSHLPVRFSTESLLCLHPPPPMQTRRQAALNVVLPNPPLTVSATALLSPDDSPRTPRSRALPTKVFSPNSNRKSSDSWNSSIHEDDFATEWKPEHIRMLQRVRDFPPVPYPMGVSSLLISRRNRLWTRCRPIYSHHSMGQSLPLIYWTRLRAGSQRLKVPRTGPIRSAQLAPKSSSLLSVEPGKAPLSPELPKSLVRKRDRARSSCHRAASTVEGPCIASPAWISSPTSNSARRTVFKTIKLSIGQ